MDTNKEEFGVRWLLRRFELSPNAYYNYLKFRKNLYNQQKNSVKDHIEKIFHSENGKMGYRMIKLTLEKQGTNLSLLTVHKYMKELNIKSISFMKRPNYVKGTSHKVFSNIINRDFTATAKNLKWCTDFTYIHLSNGRMMYNCSILDLYDRSIVASKTSNNITAELAIDTLKEAISSHKPPSGLIIHSDQGSQVRQEVA
jgi:putative transposase